jgi:hypothetical protein
LAVKLQGKPRRLSWRTAPVANDSSNWGKQNEEGATCV